MQCTWKKLARLAIQNRLQPSTRSFLARNFGPLRMASTTSSGITSFFSNFSSPPVRQQNFGQSEPLIPRLASHVFLHRLVRLNRIEQASILASQMMSAGIPVRCKTLEAIFHCIRQNSRHGINGRRSGMPADFLENSDVLVLRPSIVSDRETKFAIDLLMVARRSRQRRSHEMFRMLMALCIVNGEIIVASLIFGILLRDWQARELTGNLVPENAPAIQHPFTPFPVYIHLEEICISITRNLASDKMDLESQFAFKASLQALANLATMLDHQTIAYRNISPLLAALYECPRVQDLVWIYDHWSNPKQVVAYKYFHQVLHRFILSLPTHIPPQDERKKMLPPLDVYSYNSLLHYSLRHRHSTALAERILHHMIHERYEPVEPDTTTLNIITRSGTLLRDSRIANLALSKLKGSPNSFMSVPEASEFSSEPSPLRSLLSITERDDDKYTLSARIAHLTATGQFQTIIDSLPRLFPTLLARTEHGHLSEDEWDDLTKRHEQDLHQSISLGPVVFTCILNALQKAGRTVLAGKVWRWARKVEEMSWTVKVKGQLRPWCLPVISYTIMIKLYSLEVKKAGTMMDRRTFQKPQHIKPIGWGGRSIRGAHFLKTGNPWTRSAMGRFLGMWIYRSMRKSAEVIRAKISELRKKKGVRLQKKELQIPNPDARFFNAILQIVGRHPHAPPRSLRQGPGHYKRQYRNRYLDYVWRGIIRQPPRPELLQVGKDMIAAGFEIPWLFRKYFVGMPEVGGSLGQVEPPRIERDRRVFAAEKAWCPRELVGKTMIPVQDTRTLDLSSKRWRRRRRPVTRQRQALRRRMAWRS